MSENGRGDTGVPSAQVPGVDVEAEGGGAPDDAQPTPYVDGNLDDRGDVRSGRAQVEPGDAETLDDALDTTPRTDGTGTDASE